MTTAKPRKLELYRDLAGGVQAGYERVDAPMVHCVLRGEQGERLSAAKLKAHWPCSVCATHGYTAEDFADQWAAALNVFNAAEARRNAAEPVKSN